jgi:acyl-coenzyme A thioesterase PaaI-like protein
MPAASRKSTRKSIQRLLDQMEMKSRRAATSPGFSSVLSLTPERLIPQQFALQKHIKTKANKKILTLTFRYTLSSRLLLTKLDTTIALSTYLSILEDITTWALWLAKPRRQAPPEVSVSLLAEWGPGVPHWGLFPGSVVDVTATVSKHGKNLRFVRAEVRDKDNGALICFASYTKYLAVHKPMKALLSPLSGCFQSLYSKASVSEPSYCCQVNIPMSDLFESLDFVGHTQAIFTASSKHANSTMGGGPVHGGCQIILMELVGRQVAKHAMASAHAYLDSIQISYQSPATTKLQFDAQVLSIQLNSVSMRVVVSSMEDDATSVIVSEGILTFFDSMESKQRRKQRPSQPPRTGNPPFQSHDRSITHRTETTGDIVPSSRSFCYRKTGSTSGGSSCESPRAGMPRLGGPRNGPIDRAETMTTPGGFMSPSRSFCYRKTGSTSGGSSCESTRAVMPRLGGSRDSPIYRE